MSGERGLAVDRGQPYLVRAAAPGQLAVREGPGRESAASDAVPPHRPPGRGHITLQLPEGWHREHEWLNLLYVVCGPPAAAA